LAVLNISDVDNLSPCKPQIIDVGTVVERKQLSEVLEQIETTTNPVLAHAAGGVGKTVFMANLEHKLRENCEVVSSTVSAVGLTIPLKMRTISPSRASFILPIRRLFSACVIQCYRESPISKRSYVLNRFLLCRVCETQTPTLSTFI